MDQPLVQGFKILAGSLVYGCLKFICKENCLFDVSWRQPCVERREDVATAVSTFYNKLAASGYFRVWLQLVFLIFPMLAKSSANLPTLLLVVTPTGGPVEKHTRTFAQKHAVLCPNPK